MTFLYTIIYFLCFFIIIIPEKAVVIASSFISNFYYSFRKGHNLRCLEDLIREVKKIESFYSVGMVNELKVGIEYKFYTGLINKLISYICDYGIDGQTIFFQLNSILSFELELERRSYAEYMNMLIQVLLMILSIWSVILFSINQLGISDRTAVYNIVFFQGLGLFLYLLLYRLLKKVYYKNLYAYYHSFIVFKSLISCGVDLGTVNDLSSYNQLDLIPTELKELDQQIHLSIKNFLELGKDFSRDFEIYQKEINAVFENKNKNFTNILQSLKFITLLFFFLPSLFYYFYSTVDFINHG